jgi:hypothetical protein
VQAAHPVPFGSTAARLWVLSTTDTLICAVIDDVCG